MRYFKLGHPPSENEIRWYILDGDKVCVSDEDSNFYWVTDTGWKCKTYTTSLEELTTKFNYVETTEKEFNKYLLTVKLKK